MNKYRILKTILPLFYVERKRRFTYLVSAFTFILTIFILSPIDLYLNNVTDFIINLSHVIVALSRVFLLLAVIAVFVLPLIFRGITLDVITLLFVGLNTAAYAQTLFMNGRMGSLTHAKVSFSGSHDTLNWIIWLVIVVLPLCIWKALSDKKGNKVKWETGVICVSVVIVGMQMVGIFVAGADYSKKNIKPYNYISVEEALVLSSDENILVFVMDMLDAEWMNTVLETYPELNEQLDGFTFYKNNVSVFTHTSRTLLNLFNSKHHNDNRTSVQHAWDGDNLLDTLRQNGYSIRVLPDFGTTFGSFDNLYGRVDNYIPIEDSPSIQYSGIAEIITTMSYVKTMPYIFKDIFITAGFLNNYNERFLSWPIRGSAWMTVSEFSDVYLYNELKAMELSLQDEKKTFFFAHLISAHHGGYRYNIETGEMEIDPNFDKFESAHGSFVILSEFFEQMKKLGIYDNSTIIIIADHGSVFNLDPLISPVTSTLMIKPKNSRGTLESDTTSELSHVNFQSTIMQIAGLPQDEYGLSYFDIIEDQLPQQRKMYIGGQEYIIEGDANDFSNWNLS